MEEKEISFECLGKIAISEAVLESADIINLDSSESESADDIIRFVRTNILGANKISIFDKCLDILRSASWPAMGAYHDNATLESCADLDCWNIGISTIDDNK